MTITEQDHRIRHERLHAALDELLADYIGHTGKLPSKTTVLEFVKWSYQQAISPSAKSLREGLSD